MEEKKTDRRTLKTKKAICNAMMDLLTQKELHKVTVQEITDIADINRATFYKHYLDVYDLYDQLERDILIDWGMLVLKLEQAFGFPAATFLSLLGILIFSFLM